MKLKCTARIEVDFGDGRQFVSFFHGIDPTELKDKICADVEHFFQRGSRKKSNFIRTDNTSAPDRRKKGK